MSEKNSMKFIELTGKNLAVIISNDEIHNTDLDSAGVADDSIIRVNQQGDIEVRKANKWAIVGGLLGDFENRLKETTGLDWV